jgi:hypothetical protein
MLWWEDFTHKRELLDSMEEQIVLSKDNKKVRYYNIPVSFDTETTSWKEKVTDNNGKTTQVKRACMYVWAFSVNGIRVYGRTWDEFRKTLFYLKQRLNLSRYQRLMIFVHNLAYDFQFFRHHVTIDSVFARKKRKPIKVLCEDKSFEFRCSYILSGLSLANVAKDLETPIRKLVGDLDYSLPRHSKTELTEKELRYLDYDVYILHHYISEEISRNNNDISRIPLTKTGYVRRYCREYIRKNSNWKSYRAMIKKEGATDPDLFILLNKAFAGGFTHANYSKVHYRPLLNVHSNDFASSYPAVMVCEKFPRGKFYKTQITSLDQFRKLTQSYACVFEIKLTDITPKSDHHVWSRHKCLLLDDEIIDNGRIVAAKSIITYMTDVDLKIFEMFYDCKIQSVGLFYWAKYDYLPKPLIECILKYYKDKTQLKGVENMVAEYFVAKGMINGIYGMMVTNPLNDEILYDDEDNWACEEPDIESTLQYVYNKNEKTFLSYQWGVWVTAHARYNLLSQVFQIGEDAIYCDTDSVKYQHREKYITLFENYNQATAEKMRKVCEHYDIDFESTQPEDRKGNKHPLGAWTYEGKYEQFRTLGAKRYCYSIINDKNEWEFHITVSGLPNVTEEEYEDEEGNIRKRKLKYCPTQYILDHGDFDYFRDEMVIPADYSRRTTMTYIDKPFKTTLVDYKGVECEVEELSGIHAEKSSYKMSFSDEFASYLLNQENGLTVRRKKRAELAVNPFDIGVGVPLS